jgi:anaerobic dimethyl sulfoxide reductase subunit A
MADPLCPPIPMYMRTPEDRMDPISERFPLQMVSPHPKNRVHSDLHHVDWLQEVEPHRMWIHPLDAAARGIRDGERVYVFNEQGRLAIEAWMTERIMPGVVCVFEGAWYAPDKNGIDQGGNPNILIRDDYTRGGSSTFNTVLVDVEKAP